MRAVSLSRRFPTMTILNVTMARMASLLADPTLAQSLRQLNSLIWLVENGAASVYISSHRLTDEHPTVLVDVTFVDGGHIVGKGDDLQTAVKDMLAHARITGPLANG